MRKPSLVSRKYSLKSNENSFFETNNTSRITQKKSSYSQIKQNVAIIEDKMRKMNSNKFLDDASMSPIYTSRRQSPKFKQWFFKECDSNLEKIKQKVKQFKIAGNKEEELMLVKKFCQSNSFNTIDFYHCNDESTLKYLSYLLYEEIFQCNKKIEDICQEKKDLKDQIEFSNNRYQSEQQVRKVIDDTAQILEEIINQMKSNFKQNSNDQLITQLNEQMQRIKSDFSCEQVQVPMRDSCQYLMNAIDHSKNANTKIKDYIQSIEMEFKLLESSKEQLLQENMELRKQHNQQTPNYNQNYEKIFEYLNKQIESLEKEKKEIEDKQREEQQTITELNWKNKQLESQLNQSQLLCMDLEKLVECQRLPQSPRYMNEQLESLQAQLKCDINQIVKIAQEFYKIIQNDGLHLFDERIFKSYQLINSKLAENPQSKYSHQFKPVVEIDPKDTFAQNSSNDEFQQLLILQCATIEKLIQ